MMGWLFGGLVKQFEGAAKEVVRESSKEIANLFNDKLYPLADKLDYITQESINHAIEKTEELESKVKADIEHLCRLGFSWLLSSGTAVKSNIKKDKMLGFVPQPNLQIL